jgi:thymidylate kinase
MFCFLSLVVLFGILLLISCLSYCLLSPAFILLLLGMNRSSANVHSRKSIEADIAKGITIVCDRYTCSGMIYSAAKRNPNLSLSWAREPDVGLPRPDLIIFLNLDLEQAERRGGFGEEKYEKRALQQEVKRLFEKVHNVDGTEEGEDMWIVDAKASAQEVHVQVMKVVDEKLEDMSQVKGLELRRIDAWTPGLLKDENPIAALATGVAATQI